MGSESVQRWRRKTKKLLVDGCGGKCARCGYDRCLSALEFHHIDPTTKCFEIASALVHPKAWNLIVDEVKKCVVLCGCCHSELHEGMWSLDDIFIQKFQNTKPIKELSEKYCPICGNKPEARNTFCSRQCAGKNNATFKGNWPKDEVLISWAENLTKKEIGRRVGVSDVSVGKRLKKILT